MTGEPRRPSCHDFVTQALARAERAAAETAAEVERLRSLQLLASKLVAGTEEEAALWRLLEEASLAHPNCATMGNPSYVNAKGYAYQNGKASEETSRG